MINESDKFVVQDLAKAIFNKCKTIANIGLIQDEELLTTALDLYNKKACRHNAMDNEDKVFSLFCAYIDGMELYKDKRKRSIKRFDLMRLFELRDAAQEMEINICEKESLDHIDDYILEIISIQDVNSKIEKKENIEVESYEEEKFEHSLTFYQHKIKHLREEIRRAKISFSQYNIAYSAYVLRYEKILLSTIKTLNDRAYDHVLEIEKDIRIEMAQTLDYKRIPKKHEWIDWLDKDETYKTIETYVDAYQHIYFSPYTSNTGDNSVSKSAHRAYLLLREISEFPNVTLLEALSIKEMCSNVAKKLFSPISCIKKGNDNEETTNVQRCTWGILDNKSDKSILESFRMPAKSTRKNFSYLWGCIDNTTDINLLRERIDTLAFFQNYVDSDNLYFLLRDKLKLQQLYASQLDCVAFQEYYKHVTYDIMQGKRGPRIPCKNAALIQKYDQKLIETLLEEKDQREGLRRACRAHDFYLQ